MSYPLLKEDVLFRQRILRAAGYSVALDGIWGPKTDAADQALHIRTEQIAKQLGRFDPRTEQNIATLLPVAQEKARKFMKVAVFKDVRIISGTRTYHEQDLLYAQRPKVTLAKGGQSNHNFGIAWDIGVFVAGSYVKDRTVYISVEERVRELCEIEGIEWGGRWHALPDVPHYQLSTRFTKIAQVADAFENGEPYLL